VGLLADGIEAALSDQRLMELRPGGDPAGLLVSVAWTTDRIQAGVPCRSISFSRRCAVSEAEYLRKHALECLRLAADSMQLACDDRNPARQAHFVRMAIEWTILAEQGPAGANH
jgi:hypothetical protein